MCSANKGVRVPVSERSYCGKCGHPVARESRFCGECGAPITDAEGGDFSAYDVEDLGPEGVSFLANYTDEKAALLNKGFPLSPGWYPDPLAVGWARKFDGQSWLGLQRRVLTEAERAELHSASPSHATYPPPSGPYGAVAPPPPNPASPSPTFASPTLRATARPTNSSGVRKGVLIGLGCAAGGLVALVVFAVVAGLLMGSPIEVGTAQCTSDGAAVVQVTNKSSSVKQVYVDVGYYDASGLQLDTGNALEDIPAGTTARLRTTASSHYGVSTCKVIKTSSY